MNYQNNRYNPYQHNAPRGPRRRRRRVTGRFYAFVTVVLVLIVFVGVLISRGLTPEDTNTAGSNKPVPIETPAPEAYPTPAPGAPDMMGGEAQPQAQPAIPIEYDEDQAPAAGDERMDTSNLSVTQGLSSDWRNILLLGSDSRDVSKLNNTDTILIGSVNVKDGRVKLTSIMRDTVVDFVNKKGETQTVKINSVARFGGPEAIMKLVNELLGMNITEYVIINFAGFQGAIDALGGIRMDITEAEKNEINKSLGEQAKAAGMDQQQYLANKKNMELTMYGADLPLTGIQALAYARIRHVGNGDVQRTERQRAVLDAVLRKVKNDANVIQIAQMATRMLGYVQTNINVLGEVGLAMTVLQNSSSKIETLRLPRDNTTSQKTRGGVSALWDTDFEANKQALYQFIYQS